MKITKLDPKAGLAVVAGGTLILASILAVRPLLAQQAPGLTIALLSSNQVRIMITNGSNQVSYEIYRTPVLGDPIGYPFLLETNGTLGQTNFTIDMGIEVFGFFIGTVGTDWDGDGIPNWQDGNPSNTNIGALTITIDKPLHGTIFN